MECLSRIANSIPAPATRRTHRVSPDMVLCDETEETGSSKRYFYFFEVLGGVVRADPRAQASL
jgi:hypothetical protein